MGYNTYSGLSVHRCSYRTGVASMCLYVNVAAWFGSLISAGSIRRSDVSSAGEVFDVIIFRNAACVVWYRVCGTGKSTTEG